MVKCRLGACMNRKIFRDNILELIRRTSAFLPPDVESVINLQRKLEVSGSKADFALELVAQNIGLAKARSLPICQDTGTINFYFETPRGVDQLELEELCCDAVKEATSRGYLRQNSVDSVDGKNTGDNLGPGSPVFHWEQTRDSNMDVRLILKGGGCENMSAQYSLPEDLSRPTRAAPASIPSLRRRAEAPVLATASVERDASPPPSADRARRAGAEHARS